jgi:HK97 family phage portal protein
MLANLLSSRGAVRDPKWSAWGAGADIGGSGNTAAGMSVSTSSAQQLITVYTCVSFIADAIAALPVEVYRSTGGVRREVPAPRWLSQPNRERSWQEFAHEFISSLLLSGNAYVVQVPTGSGTTSELYVLHPSKVQVSRPRPNALPVYEVEGRRVGPVYHARAYPVPGELIGLSPIEACRETIGVGLALEAFAGTFFGNGASPSGVIEAPAGTEVDAESLQERWSQLHRGVSKANRVGVLVGASYKPITVAPEQAQFLQSRNFTSAQIAALFKIPPELVGASLPGSSSLTYANITERWNDLLRRWLPWIEQLRRMVTVMLPGPGETGWIAEIDTDAYAKASLAERFSAYATGIQAGFLTPEDVRPWENLGPLATAGTPAVEEESA